MPEAKARFDGGLGAGQLRGQPLEGATEAVVPPQPQLLLAPPRRTVPRVLAPPVLRSNPLLV
jgi:hypothetical protein